MMVLFDWKTGSITKVVGNVEKNTEKKLISHKNAIFRILERLFKESW